MMSLHDKPLNAALDDDADLVECAENILVSIPAAVISFLSQPAIVQETTGLCGS